MKSRGLLPYGMSLNTMDDLWKVLFIIPAMALGVLIGDPSSASDTGSFSMPVLYGGLAAMLGYGIWLFTRKLSNLYKTGVLVLYLGGLTAVLFLTGIFSR
jgi:hypothetical protein